MTIPIALQLYTVRELLASDFKGIIRRIADTGYAGVETTFLIPGTTLEQAAILLNELDLKVASAHVPLPLGNDKNAVLEYADLFGLNQIVSMKHAEDFANLDNVRRVCDLFNQAQQVCADHGLSLAYHNHWWEFQEVAGRSAFDIMIEHLDPAIGLELDIYWAQSAGRDPVKLVESFGSRIPLLHIKDGPAVRGVPQVAVGEGNVDVRGVIDAATATDWLIVELDDCATDMMAAVEQSYRYLALGGMADDG